MHFPLIDLIGGIGIGIVISLPLGPVGLITMKRTAEFGLRAGVISGVAIALIDTSAAVLVLLGLHQTIPYIRVLPHWVHLIGGIVVFFYGLRIVFSAPLKHQESALPWHQHFMSSLVMTITNPSTYVSFGVIGLLISRYIDRPLFTRLEVVVGFFLGALLWWCMLAYIAFSQRDKYLNTQNLNRVIGFVIIILALITFFGPYNIKWDKPRIPDLIQ